MVVQGTQRSVMSPMPKNARIMQMMMGVKSTITTMPICKKTVQKLAKPTSQYAKIKKVSRSAMN